METTIKTDVTGLIKVATLNSFAIDGNGNYSLKVSFYYKTLTGDILLIGDASKASQTITGSAPAQADPSVALTADEQAQVDAYNALIAQLQPIIKTIIPNS